MSNQAPLGDLNISDEEISGQEETDDIIHSPKWGEEVPEEFGAEVAQLRPDKRTRRNVATAAPTKRSEQRDLASEREALEAMYEAEFWAGEQAMLEHGDEAEMAVSDMSMTEEQDPTRDDVDISFSAANFGAEEEIGGKGARASDELRDLLDDVSDLSSEHDAPASGNDFQVGTSYTHLPASSDTPSGTAIDATVEPITESHAELKQSLEPHIQEICRECAFLREELESRDRKIAMLEAQNAALAQKPSYLDVSTNTETPPLKENEHSILPKESGKTSQQAIVLPPASPLLMQTGSSLMRFIHGSLDMAKKLFLIFAEFLNATLQQGQKFFLSDVDGPIPFMEKMRIAFNAVWAIITCLASPCCFTMNAALLASLYNERETWIQANALTRKHMLRQVSGGSFILELMFMTMGSLAYTT